MRVSCTNDVGLPGATIAEVSGSLDMVGSEAFLQALDPRLTPEKPSLLLDLTQVEWVSSAGVGALVRLLTHTRSLKGGFAMYGCGQRVRTVLRICGLEGPLNVQDTAEAARARLREPGAG
jgi:anti-anti-sigma factor